MSFKQLNKVFRLQTLDSQFTSAFSRLENAVVIGFIAVAYLVIGIAASIIFNSNTMLIVWPILASTTIFTTFTYYLWYKFRDQLFGEIGFLYLMLALAYIISPATKFIILEMNIPITFDGMNFAVLKPRPDELGKHFWRHLIFISGFALGYLAFRGNKRYYGNGMEKAPVYHYGYAIFIMLFIIVSCIGLVTILLPPAKTYIEHYTRFNSLSQPVLTIVYICLIFKNGGYFVLLALLFREYARYKALILFLVPLICTYEVLFSIGSRIIALTILMAVLGFYHFKANPITIKKGLLLLAVLAIIFSIIGQIRHYGFNLHEAQYNIIDQNKIVASELEAVYCTSFHLYSERSARTLPSRDFLMFLNDIIMLIPFIDHTTYNPQYWYSRHYFPNSEIAPTTMGILVNSAIWGGEFDLLIRSLVNGSFFALLYRWFLKRQEKWWALTIYIFCIAYCIMTLKYSTFYIFTPLLKVLLPPLLLIGVVVNLQKRLSPKNLLHAKSVP